jgi:P-type Ca2+ transporter type 2C
MIATSPSPSVDPVRDWHALTAREAARELGVTPATGLDDSEVRRRRETVGPNTLPEPERRPRVMLLLDQLRNPLILLLVGAAAIAAFVGDLEDSAVIAAVIVINSILGFVQESRAENSLESLRQMLAPTCVVRRGGLPEEIPAADLVPGDIVVVEAGSQVPADGRLLVAEQLEVDESALTGESVPTAKDVAPTQTIDAPVGDRSSMAFMNTLVTRGRGELVVTATGSTTEMGRLAELIKRTPIAATPLQRQLAQLGKRLAAIGGVAVAAYLVMGLLRGEAWNDVVLSAVALAVAAVPEGLPVVVTVTLAVGAHQMARQGALVKHLASVETLGATSVVCTDKTGTLTVNEMTVRDVWIGGHPYSVTGEGYHAEGELTAGGAPVAEQELDALRRLGRAARCATTAAVTRAEVVIGDPMEAALLVLAAKARPRAQHRVLHAQLAAHRRSPVRRAPPLHGHRPHGPGTDPGHALLAVKGALDALLRSLHPSSPPQTGGRPSSMTPPTPWCLRR